MTIPSLSKNEPPGDPRETVEFDAAAALKDPFLGRVVGNYHVLSRVGGGSFGAVYMARDVKLGRTVALKLLRFPEESTARENLLREARVLAQLSEHPAIVQIYSWGEFEDQCYFALEFFEQSAAALLLDAPQGLDAATAVGIMEQCVDAVGFAHGHGLLHRDIKPANILVDSRTGKVKLCDFGLARFYTHARDAREGLAGSPAFMSPEQIRGEVLGRECDIFALGTTFYQLLTGRLPFEGPTAAEAFKSILAHDWVPLRERRPELPAELENIVRKCLEPKPEDRYRSAAELKTALATLHPAAPADAPSADPRPVYSRRKAFLVYLAAALAVILGAIIFPVLPHREGAPAMNVATAAARTYLEHGQYASASTAYRELLAQQPQDEQALYGLGYALLLQGDSQNAAATFAQLTNKQLADEGLAAVEQTMQPLDASEKLHGLAATGGSPYSIVLLAASHLATEEYGEVRNLLTPVDPSTLEFDWQRARYFQALGQACFRLGDLARARDAFEQLARLNAPAAAPLASDFLEMSQRGLDTQARQDLSAQIARLKDLRDGQPAPAPQDAWTSRPVRLWIPPAKAGKSPLATQTGLADVLAWKLSKALMQQKNVPVEIVEREYAASILTEQELSAQLSSQNDAVKLGGLLGARFALFCEFSSVMNEETLNIKIVDTETSRVTPVEEFSLTNSAALAEWVNHVADTVAATIIREFPLRGIVQNTPNGPALNIGEDVGVRPGMRFKIMTGPGGEFALPNTFAEAAENVGAATAPVVLSLPAGAQLPEAGWYAEAVTMEAAPA